MGSHFFLEAVKSKPSVSPFDEQLDACMGLVAHLEISSDTKRTMEFY